MTIIKVKKEKCVKGFGDLVVCEVDDLMNPLGEVAQAIWKKAGEELNEFRRKTATLPLQEYTLLKSPSFKLKSFKEIVCIVMPVFDNPSELTVEDRAKLKHCYDTLFSYTGELKIKKTVLPFLGTDRNQGNCKINTADAVNVAFGSAFEAIRNPGTVGVEEFFFSASVPEVAEYARSTELYKNRKNRQTRTPNPRPCTIGESDSLPLRISRCFGKNASLLSVIDNKENKISDLFGCTHEADLIMSRIGKFDVDWNSDGAAKYEICERHLRIFLRDWRNPFHRHFKTSDGNLLCSFPDHQGPATTLNTVRTHYVFKTDSIRWMSKRKSILKVGTPICIDDLNLLRGSDFDLLDDDEYTPRTRTPTTPRTPRTPTTVKKDVEKAANGLLAAVSSVSNVYHRKDFSDLHKRQQYEKERMVRGGLHAMVDVVAPDAKEELLARIINGERIKPIDSCAPIRKMLSDAADLYERTDSKLHRLFILSSVAQFPLSLLQQYFDGLTDYYHKKARDLVVRGTVESVKRIVRVRYEEDKLDKLIEFILSPLVALNLPFDERLEKMSDGSKMSMPNLQRLQTIDEVYRMYLIWLEEEGIPEMALKETTAKYIIKLVAPTRRKNLTCVDEKIADGMKAFDELFSSLFQMLKAGFIDKQTVENLTKNLQSGKAYLRGDFKVHVKLHSNCADHCATYALSDPNSPLCFAETCDHVHDVICERCSELEATLNLMQEMLDDAEKHSSPSEREHFSILNEECAIHCEAINDMKKHQIRAALSHMEKTEYVKSLKAGQAIVTLDWAQKLCPLYAREKQTEYYAKSGIAYHMSHAETVIDEKPAEHLSVHMFKPGEKQDGTAVYLVIESFLLELKKMGINRVILRSDCAGCYRNAPLICSLYNLQKKINMKIDGLLFSEAQAGKGPCDRGSARVKGKTRDHVTSIRGKVETPEEFFNAVTTGKLLNGVSIHQCTIANVKNAATKIPNITSYSSFEFESNGIRLRRHRTIGQGLLFDHRSLAQCDGQLTTVQSGGHTIAFNDLFWLTSSSHQSKETSSTVSVEKESSGRNGMLHCLEEGCIKEFRSFHQLQRHIVSGKHEYQLERKTIHDYCVEMASLSLLSKTKGSPVDGIVNNAVHGQPSDLPQGWALRETKQRNPNDKQARQLIREFFAEKRKNKLKANAHEAETYMKNARDEDGKLKISPRNRLSITQIKSMIRGLLDKEDPSSTTVKKKKKNSTTSIDTLNSSDEEEEEAVAEDFSDSDDEEFVRDLIHNHRDEIFEKEENSTGRKRKSMGK